MLPHLNGYTTTAALLDAGLTERAIADRVERGELTRLQRGRFAYPAARSTRFERAAFALVAIDGRGMVTGAEGLRMLGHGLRQRWNVADIVVPHKLHVPDVKGVEWRRSTRLDVGERGVPAEAHVAPDWWALGDLARDLPDGQLGGVIAAGVASGRWTLDRLDREALRDHRFPGRMRLRRVLEALRSDLPFSGTEKRVAVALRKAGHRVGLQHRLATTSGRGFVLDLALLDVWLDLEIDGPHHLMPEQAAEDRVRDRLIRDTSPWTVERASVYEIDADLPAFVGAVGRMVASKRRMLRRLGLG